MLLYTLIMIHYDLWKKWQEQTKDYSVGVWKYNHIILKFAMCLEKIIFVADFLSRSVKSTNVEKKEVPLSL